METDAFKEGIDLLFTILEPSTAVMCAEIVWFRCHRRYIADALAGRFSVIHIIDTGKAYPHERKGNKIRCD